ncbi:uncharacterized protein [Gossypium hirsutum]|uniref:Reverse transcriptase domain-containing protein n=1 Tax=Gossypium hirsutum TaxID=3635 RepID=A0A1U8IME8_GOSHI|nr:uncharacterized protein LOC107898276 [Gossypium hirsutum]
MSNYVKFMKDILSKKRKLGELETVALTEGCTVMLKNKLPPKLKDPGSFTIPYSIGNHYVGKVLYDLGASINLMPMFIFRKLRIGNARPTTITLQLADRSYVHPEGKIEDVLYAYLGENDTFPVVISAKHTIDQKMQLLEVLKKSKKSLGWLIADIKGITLVICIHKIILEDCHGKSIEWQRRLNPVMKEVVKKEIVKWLDLNIIYPISNSSWVSVPKKGGVTVVSNDNNKLIPTRTITGWRVCMNYQKLNKAMKNDHFPLPFIDQMLDTLEGKAFYVFLDGYSGYNQIAISLTDQEKTTFTYPYGPFAFRRMSFGLCNAPAAFQHCMMAIISDMVEKFLEVFMDDFSVFGDTFEDSLKNLESVLSICQETNLVLNW